MPRSVNICLNGNFTEMLPQLPAAVPKYYMEQIRTAAEKRKIIQAPDLLKSEEIVVNKTTKCHKNKAPAFQICLSHKMI